MQIAVASAHRVGVGAVTRDATANHDAAQVALPRDLLAGFVGSAREPKPAALRIDHDFDAVERVAARVVVADVSAFGNHAPALPVLAIVEDDDQAAGRSDQLPVQLDGDLALGEDPDLALELLSLPGPDGREASTLEVDQVVEILDGERTHDEAGCELVDADRQARGIRNGRCFQKASARSGGRTEYSSGG